MVLKNKISTEFDPINLRNLLQQLHKLDIDPMFNIQDINYEVSNKFVIFLKKVSFYDKYLL